MKCTSPARIRAYQARDFPEIHRIDQVCFPPDIAYSRAELLFYVRHPESITRVAELDRAVVGFIVGRIESSGTAHVGERRGVGSALMAALHAELETREVRLIFLEVDVANEAARRFYERFGYRVTALLKGYYKGRSHALRMVWTPEAAGRS